MICPNYPDPKYFIFSDKVPDLLYYSHIPAIVIALLLGFFIFFRGENVLLKRIMLAISLVFSFWVFLNLITWTSNDSTLIMFVWTFFGTAYVALSNLCLYFTIVFINGRDITGKMKIFLSSLVFPMILLAPTSLNVEDFSLDLCGVVNEGQYYAGYYYGVGFLMFIWISVFLFLKYRKSDKSQRTQILLLWFGIEFFLLSFFLSGFVSSFLLENSYDIEFYGLFGMTVFMVILAYLIVRYGAFKIKLVGAQALVVGLVILVGSQLFFAKSGPGLILAGVTLSLSLAFGYFLIKSVKLEIKQREELEIANQKIIEHNERLQLMTEKLADSNDQLRKLDATKNEFISVASHQLRTPITVVKGFVSMLLEGSYGDVGEEVRGILNKVYISSERLIHLIEDLLNVSRIETGNLTFEFGKTQLGTLLEELLDGFRLLADEKKLSLTLKLPADPLPEIVMDRLKIRELISNFIDNALKYTEKGGVEVSVELLESGVVVDENGFVLAGKKAEVGKVFRIIVADTGIGVPRDEIPALFKKFSRGKDISRLHAGGTGLGLFVGKAIAQAHNGQVWVESEGTDKGSKFIIEIPIEHREKSLS